MPVVRSVLFASGANGKVILYILLSGEQWKLSLNVFQGIYRGKLFTDVHFVTRLGGRACYAADKEIFAPQHRHLHQRVQG